MTTRRSARELTARALVPVALVLALAGCGGGGGGGVGVAGRAVDYSSNRASRATGTPLAGATVSVSYWSAPTTPIAQTTTDAEGRYSIQLPSEASTKAILLVATKGDLRASRVIGDLSAYGRAEADLDNYTSVVTEYLLSHVSQSTALSGPPVETIMGEIRKDGSIGGASLVAGGDVMPDNLGGGIRSVAVAAALNTSTINKAIAQIAGDPDIQEAKRFAEMTREALWALGINGQKTADSLAVALNDQWQGIKAGTQGLSDLTHRVRVVIQALWNGRDGWDTLDGMAPGKYDYVLNSVSQRKLQLTGPAPDGKSWIVTSKLDDSTKDAVLNITPRNQIPTFDVTIDAGAYTFTVTRPGETALNWSGTLSGTKDSQGRITSATLSMTVRDPALKAPFVFNGTITGSPAGTHEHEYDEFHVSGSVQSQFANGRLDDAMVQWYTTSRTANLKKIQATNFTFTTGFTPSLKVTMNSGSITFDPYDPAIGLDFATPNTATLTGSIEGAKHSTSLTDGRIVFARDIHGSDPPGGNPYMAFQPKSISGKTTFKSPSLNYSGTLDGTFDYLPVPVNVADVLGLVLGGHVPSGFSGSWPVSRFPKFSLRFAADITPAVGPGGGVDVTLSASPTAGTGSVPQMAATLNRFWYGNEAMAGGLTVTFGASGGNVVWDRPSVLAQFTRSPSNYYLRMSGTSLDNLTGGIYNNSSMSTQYAKIGPANGTEIGLSELGNTPVIKYSDNSFETFLSIIPTLP